MRKKPNIIIINCDDLGWGDLGCTGHPLHKTPYLDSLAENGTRFTNFYQGSSVCSPSRGAMLTGCYPNRIGFDSFDGKWVLFCGESLGLSKEEETFADILKRAGYSTHMVGKWHCGDQEEFLPTNHGFDSYYGLPYSNDMGIQRVDSKYPPLPLLRDTEVVEAQPDQRSLIFRYTEACTEIIRNNKDRPFLLYMAHMHVHLPHYVAEKFTTDSKNGRYGGAVAAIDWSTGLIMEELKAQGLESDTMIIFTSDNGSRCDYGPSNGHLRGVKTTAWEGGFRVPLLVSWPGHVPAGCVRDDIITGMDLLPTMASICGESLKSGLPIDGKDASDVFFGKSTDEPLHKSFAYYCNGQLDAVRDERWKLHVGRRGRDGSNERVLELYDLQNDPSELKNVVGDNPDVVAKLQAIADEWRQKFGDVFTRDTGNERRPAGRVDNPKTLTEFDPNHPYYMAMYDINESG
ncbi:MAG: sulfatase [Lentisphaerae bacterium]|nr:sulfatase [Lentisphaerota bacterium]